MRLVWIVGGHSSTKTELEAALSLERMQIQWMVRQASSIAQIPAEHLGNPGVVVLLDAFAADHPGFTGLRTLRERGFQGPVYIFGEPAPEDATAAFVHQKLTGFFPPFERADLDFVAGVLHASVAYDGTIDVSRFTAPGGRSSAETIHSLHDFNAFSQKMAAFISRFGIDLARLRKVLMALSLPHVKTDTGVPVIEHPFQIFYGMDPHKIVLSAATFSRGAGLEAMMSDYNSALNAVRSDRPFTGAMFPEFHHIAKASENLLVFTGSAQAQEGLDPVFLVTALPFPLKDRPQAASYFFSFAHVVPTPELLTADEPVEEAPLPIDADPAAVVPSAPAAPAAEAPGEAADRSGFIQSSDLGDLLSEPKLVGDRPVLSDTSGFEAPPAVPVPASEESVAEGAAEGADSAVAPDQSELAQRLRETLSECDKLRKLCDSMGKDIKRLMKERRQPSSDRELRDAQVRLSEEVKTLKLEKVKALEMVGTREKQIELLKVQIETIKKEKAA